MQSNWGGGGGHENTVRVPYEWGRKRAKKNQQGESVGVNNNLSAMARVPTEPRMMARDQQKLEQHHRPPPPFHANTQQYSAEKRRNLLSGPNTTPIQPTPLSEDHPLKIKMAQLKLTRERRRLYWSGVRGAIGDEWDNPVSYDRQAWEKEERLADEKYEDLAKKIAWAEDGAFAGGSSQLSNMIRSSRHQQKSYSHRWKGLPAKDKAVDRWRQKVRMAQTMETEQKGLFLSDEEEVHTNRDPAMCLPTHFSIPWTSEDEAVFQEAEEEREQQRIQAGREMIPRTTQTSPQGITSAFERAETNQEQRKLLARLGVMPDVILTSVQHFAGADDQPTFTNVGDPRAQMTSYVEDAAFSKADQRRRPGLPVANPNADKRTKAFTKDVIVTDLDDDQIYDNQAGKDDQEAEDDQNKKDLLEAFLKQLNDSESSESEETAQPVKLRAPLFDARELARAALDGLQNGCSFKVGDAETFHNSSLTIESPKRDVYNKKSNWVEIDESDNDNVEIINLQDTPDSDADDEKSIVEDQERCGKKIYFRPTQIPGDVIPVRQKPTFGIPSKTPQKVPTSSVRSSELTSSDHDVEDLDVILPKQAENDIQISKTSNCAVSSHPSQLSLKRSRTSFAPPQKLVSQMTSRERRDRIDRNESMLRKIRDYKMQRVMAGGVLEFKKLRLVNREEDVMFELDELRAWSDNERRWEGEKRL